MKIGDHYDVARIGAGDWQKLARACALEEERLLTMVTDVARALPDHIASARQQAITDGLSKSIIEPLAQQLIAHVQLAPDGRCRPAAHLAGTRCHDPYIGSGSAK